MGRAPKRPGSASSASQPQKRRPRPDSAPQLRTPGSSPESSCTRTDARNKSTGMTGKWNYDDEDECGPNNWPGHIDGKNQSPIDLRLSQMKVVPLTEQFHFQHYDRTLHGHLVNNGHSVQFTPDPQQELPTISGGLLDQKYRFVQYHYHWGQHDGGSEHTLGGLRYPAELHLVHQGVEDKSRLAVLGVFLKLGEQSTTLGAEQDVLDRLVECGQKTRLEVVRLQDKLPECPSSFARYNGSLTTPPCSENVVWTVFTDPVEITQTQLDLLRNVKDNCGKAIRKNYRPVQSWNDRKVFLAC